MHRSDQRMQECIDVCSECATACTQTVVHCLEQGDEHAEPQHIRLLLDCAEICQTSANFMSRGSELHAETCAVCADVCERCAESCEQLDGEELQRCAEICRRCAESCRQMAGKTRIASAA
jgi:hypothetical protein